MLSFSHRSDKPHEESLPNSDFSLKNRPLFRNNLRIAPLNNFDEFLMNDIDPKAFLQKGTQNGLSRWRDMNGEYIWKECEILSYDEKTQLFLIHFINSHIKKRVYFSFIEEIIRFFKVNRLNLLLVALVTLVLDEYFC